MVAETSLDRLACALGGRSLLPHILSNVPQMLTNESWQYRQAALNVLAATAEGCSKHMMPMLDEVVTRLLFVILFVCLFTCLFVCLFVY